MCFGELGDKNVQDAYLHELIRVRRVMSNLVSEHNTDYVEVVMVSILA